MQYVSFEHNSVHSCFFALSQRQQEEETEDYEEETFCGGLVVEQWTEPPTLKCRHLFVFKFSSSSGKSEFSFPGTFSLKITLVTFCRVHLSIDVSSQFFVSQRPPKIHGNQVERGRAEWKYNIKIKNIDMSAQIQLKNTKLSRIGETCTFYFQFVKCQEQHWMSRIL